MFPLHHLQCYHAGRGMIPLVEVSFGSNILGVRYLLPICSTMPVNILGLVFTVGSLIAGIYKVW